MANDRDGREDLVLVATRGDVALGEPRFILKDGEKYFVTFGAWEYELAQAKTPRQQRGCREVADLFQRASKIEAAHLDRARADDLGRGTAIKPPPPAPNTAIKPPKRRKSSGADDDADDGQDTPPAPVT